MIKLDKNATAPAFPPNPMHTFCVKKKINEYNKVAVITKYSLCIYFKNVIPTEEAP